MVHLQVIPTALTFGTTSTKIVAKAEGDNINVDFSNTDGTNETIGSIANLYLEEEIVP